MSRKHIITISTMLIIGLGFFVTTFFLSHRTSNLYTNKETESKDVSDATSESYTSQSRFSSQRKTKDVALEKAEETVASDIQDSSDTSGNSSDVVDSTQSKELPDSLSQSSSQDDDASQALENAAKYAALKEPFQQIQNLWAQSDSITNELTGLMSSAGTGRKIDGNEYAKKLDERNALDREILAIYREVQKNVPEAIQIKEASRDWNDFYNFYMLTYGVRTHRDKLEASLGKMPEEIEAVLQKFMFLSMPEDENFTYYEARKELERRRKAAQNR